MTKRTKSVLVLITLVMCCIGASVSAITLTTETRDKVLQDQTASFGAPENCSATITTPDNWWPDAKYDFSCTANGETKTCSGGLYFTQGSNMEWELGDNSIEKAGCEAVFSWARESTGEEKTDLMSCVDDRDGEGYPIAKVYYMPADGSSEHIASLAGTCEDNFGEESPNEAFPIENRDAAIKKAENLNERREELSDKYRNPDTSESKQDGEVNKVACSSILPNWCDEDDGQGLVKILGWILNIVTAGVGILATIGIVVSAIQYISATGDSAKLAKAKSRIFNIVIGLLAYGVMWVALEWLIPGGLISSSSSESAQTRTGGGGSTSGEGSSRDF